LADACGTVRGNRAELIRHQADLEFRRQIGMLADAAVMVVGIAGLIDEMIEHAVEQQPVIHMLPRQQFDARDRIRCEVGAHFDDQPALAGIDHQSRLRIEIAPGRGGERGCGGRDDRKTTDQF
jgi:hypothetical protein